MKILMPLLALAVALPLAAQDQTRTRDEAAEKMERREQKGPGGQRGK